MKFLLFFKAITVVSFGFVSPIFADDPNPQGWADRCIKSSENDLDWVSKREYCLNGILVYCEFALDNKACFRKLETTFSERADSLIVDLPDTISSTSPQKGFYEFRRSILSDMFAEDQCEHETQRDSCAARSALMKYLLAGSLVNWVSELEGKP